MDEGDGKIAEDNSGIPYPRIRPAIRNMELTRDSEQKLFERRRLLVSPRANDASLHHLRPVAPRHDIVSRPIITRPRMASDIVVSLERTNSELDVHIEVEAITERSLGVVAVSTGQTSSVYVEAEPHTSNTKPQSIDDLARDKPAKRQARRGFLVFWKKPQIASQSSEGEKLRKRRLFPILMLVGAVLLVAFGAYVLIDTLLTNRETRAHYDGSSSTGSGGDGAATVGDGSDETPVPSHSIDSYKVAPSLPRVITIPKIGVKARVIRVDTTADGAVQTPNNIYDTGWYGEGAKPGEQGAMFIDGHLGGPTEDGIFRGLKDLAKGDTISVERGDGKVFTYTVQKVESLPVGQVDMTKLLSVYGSATQGLNLMTCDGTFDAKHQTYSNRVAVYATLQ